MLTKRTLYYLYLYSLYYKLSIEPIILQSRSFVEFFYYFILLLDQRIEGLTMG